MRALLLAPVAVAALALPAAASASQVTKQADTDDTHCDSDCSLREAIKYGPVNDVINVPAGTYHLDMSKGQLAIDHALTISGAGPNATIVNADGHHRVFKIPSPGATGPVTLRKLQVTGGNGEGEGSGGGILAYSGYPLTLDHVRLTNNLMSYTDGADATLTDFGGGGVAVYGALTVTDSTIDYNSATETAAAGMMRTGGGAISVFAGPLSLIRTELRANAALLLASQTYSPRTVTEDGGGAVFASGAPVSVTRSTFASNSALVPKSSSTPTYSGGGGIYADGGTVTATNSTFSGNGAAVDAKLFDNGGGGVYTQGANTTLANVTIAGNRTQNGSNNAGGGIYNYGGPIKARDTIFAGNIADANANCFGSVSSQGHNLDSGNTCGLAGPGDKRNTNPLLGALAANGGPTRTQALMRGSPAINAGLACPAIDQRGHSRPRGPACDIGAFEADVPNARTGKAKKVGRHGAKLTGTLNPNGLVTQYRFQFGKTSNYGSKTALKSAGAGSRTLTRAIAVGHLKPHTRYHYRLVVVNSAGTTLGADRTFKTKRKKKRH